MERKRNISSWQRKWFFLLTSLIGILVILVSQNMWQETAVSTSAQALPNPNLVGSKPYIEEAQSDMLAVNSGGNCRYGVAHLYGGGTAPWLEAMNVGWTLNFAPSGYSLGNGAEFVRTVKVHDGNFEPSLSSLSGTISANPGDVWILGSEMESPRPVSGGNTHPNDYATAYHDGYYYIKSLDPSDKVAFGGISSMTPSRMQYLDMVWDAYVAQYNEPMPVDIWNTHIYIFPERKWNSTSQAAGRIPVGTDPLLGRQEPGGQSNRCTMDEVYCVAEHDSLTIFKEQITNLRQWMKDHGQQDKPLMISEWSLLWQSHVADEFGNTFPPQRAADFMDGALDFLESSNSSLGFPQDNNRLVQQWMWYPDWTPDRTTGDTSILIKDNWQSAGAGDLSFLTAAGAVYRSRANGSVGVNLKAGSASGVETGNGSADLKLVYYNNGETAVTQTFQVTFYADANLTQVIGTTAVDPWIRGCGRPYDAVVSWDFLASGTYSFWAKVDSGNVVGESNESNADNVVSGTVTITDGFSGPTPTNTPSATPVTPSPTPTDTPTATSTPTNTATATVTPTATNTPMPSPTPTNTPTPLPNEHPALTIEENIPTFGKHAYIPLKFNNNHHNIKSATFAIDFDESCLSYESLSWAVGTGFNVSADYDAQNPAAELSLTIESTTPGLFLTNGTLATVSLVPTCQPNGSAALTAAVNFADTPMPMMVDDNDENNTVTVTNGSVWITGLTELQWLPIIRR